MKGDLCEEKIGLQRGVGWVVIGRTVCDVSEEGEK